MKTTTLPTLAAGWLIAMFASPALAAAPDADATPDAGLKIPSLGERSSCPDQRVTIGLSGGSLIGVSVDLAVLRAELANGGTLLADGAGIVLPERALDALLDTALNVARANLLVERAGIVYVEPRAAACSSMLFNAAFVTRAGVVPGDSVTLLPVAPGASIPVFIAGAGNLADLPLRTPDFNVSNVPVAVTAGAVPVGSGGAPGAALATTGATKPGSNVAPVLNAPGAPGSAGSGSTTSTAPGVSTPPPGVSTPPSGVPTPPPGVPTPHAGHSNNGFGNGGGDGTPGRSGKPDSNR